MARKSPTIEKLRERRHFLTTMRDQLAQRLLAITADSVRRHDYTLHRGLLLELLDVLGSTVDELAEITGRLRVHDAQREAERRAVVAAQPARVETT
jgi:hypothetical protein